MSMSLLLALKILSCVFVVLTTACFLYQIVYLFLPIWGKNKPHKPVKYHKYAILIAARNEHNVLPHLLDSIRNQDYPAEYLTVHVIADNCTDDTAEIARSYGAVVYERFNTEKVGKGYAINYLFDQIEKDGGLDRFDAFLVFDADNLLLPDYITQMNKLCSDGYDAFCGYRNSKNFGGNWISSGYGLWYLHEMVHLNRSRMMMGTSCAVSGTGFGLTRRLLERCGGWNFFTLTEDLEFNAWCGTRGLRIGYCHEAELFDEQPVSFRQSWRQRTRWTQGGLQVSFRYFKDWAKGICKGGHAGYTSFEQVTLSLWGFVLMFMSFFTSLAVRFMIMGWLGLLLALGLTFIGSYSWIFIMGAITLTSEWNRIRATPWQKIKSIFAFPLFMMTYVPINLTAPFRKFAWPPIEHTVAVSADSLMREEAKV